MSNPKFDKALSIALALKEEGKYKDTLQCLKKAMKIDNQNPDVWFQIAIIMTILGHDVGAMKCYIAIKRRPYFFFIVIIIPHI